MRFAYAILLLVATAGLARAAEAVDALDEVNVARAARGLRPFVKDQNLTAGAMQAATIRASRGIHGHLQNDFLCLPAGITADAAGCAAWPPSLGWGACATFENFQYAGAAWAYGRNGVRFMHLFVRGPQSQGVSNASSRFHPVHPGPVSRGRRR